MTIATATATSLDDLKAASITNISILYDGSIWSWTPGNYTSLADDVYIVKGNSSAITVGAWVRQLADRVVFKAGGANATLRPAQTKMRDTVSVKDFGAIGDGNPSAGEGSAFSKAISAVRNSNDAAFSGQVSIPNGTYRLTAPISLPQNFVHLLADHGSTIWGASGQHVIQADSAAFALSDLRGIRIYGGQDGLRASTSGEIANINLSDLSVSAHQGNGLYFQGGLTSSKLHRITLIGGARGVYSAGGTNNNNVIADSDLTNVQDNIIHFDGLTQGLEIRNTRFEGNGASGKAQSFLSSPVAVQIIGGWSEGSHEYLVRTSGTQTDGFGVSITGLVSIGSAIGGGPLIPSKFDVGANRIIFGSNHWNLPTLAPINIYVAGVNKNLLVGKSNVWTRDTTVSGHVVAGQRTISNAAGLSIPLFTASRPNATNSTTNQQALHVRLTFLFTGYNANGFASGGVLTQDLFVLAVGSAINDVAIGAASLVGITNGISLTVQQGAKSNLATTPNMVIGSLNTGLPNYVSYSIEILHTASVEAEGFSVRLGA